MIWQKTLFFFSHFLFPVTISKKTKEEKITNRRSPIITIAALIPYTNVNTSTIISILAASTNTKRKGEATQFAIPRSI
ncbi:hypothetical protein BDE02_01G362100 [Populus trichocarpa]|nr:hypothetical protein BDE02_01G362100 [Populus trichocarpa]